MCDLCYEEVLAQRREIKRLKTRAAKVAEALRALVIVNGKEIGYRTMHAKSIEKKVRAALAAAQPEEQSDV